MYLASSRLSRLAAIKITLDRSCHLDEDLVRGFVVHACGGDPFLFLAELRPLISAQAWTDVGLSLIAHELPDWCVIRLCSDDGLWWCSMNPRQPVYWMPCDVDEPHPVLPIAILKAFLTALIRRDCATPALPAPRVLSRISIPAHCE